MHLRTAGNDSRNQQPAGTVSPRWFRVRRRARVLRSRPCASEAFSSRQWSRGLMAFASGHLRHHLDPWVSGGGVRNSDLQSQLANISSQGAPVFYKGRLQETREDRFSVSTFFVPSQLQVRSPAQSRPQADINLNGSATARLITREFLRHIVNEAGQHHQVGL